MSQDKAIDKCCFESPSSEDTTDTLTGPGAFCLRCYERPLSRPEMNRDGVAGQSVFVKDDIAISMKIRVIPGLHAEVKTELVNASAVV